MPAPATLPTQVPRALVQPPPAGPSAPFGLFTAATLAEGIDPHELNGIEYEATCSTTVREWPPRCAAAAGGAPAGYDQKQPDPTSSVTAADPFVVYAAENCVLGNTSPAGLDRLRSRFTAGEQTAVERVFFTGVLGNRPALSAVTPPEPAPGVTAGPRPVILNSGAALGVAQALGLLEHWLASVSGATGIIHAPRWTAETIATGQLLGTQGPRARTKAGNDLVFGTGYPGTAPANFTPASGDTENNTWLYATRPVQIRRSTVVEPSEWGAAGTVELDRNTGFRMVERAYVVDVPCNEIAAVRTNLPVLSLPGGTSQHTTSTITEET